MGILHYLLNMSQLGDLGFEILTTYVAMNVVLGTSLELVSFMLYQRLPGRKFTITGRASPLVVFYGLRHARGGFGKMKSCEDVAVQGFFICLTSVVCLGAKAASCRQLPTTAPALRR